MGYAINQTISSFLFENSIAFNTKMGYCLKKSVALGFRGQLVFFNFELVSEGDLNSIEVVRSCKCHVSLLHKLEIIIIRRMSHMFN